MIDVGIAFGIGLFVALVGFVLLFMSKKGTFDYFRSILVIGVATLIMISAIISFLRDL